MSGGIYFRFTVGRAGTAGANTVYITRLTATRGDTEAIFLHNYPAHVGPARGYEELRAGIVAYNQQREDEELRKGHHGSGKTRTHYRARASFEGEVSNQKALSLVREYLEKHFPDARAVACVHRDTDHTHVHINMQARQINERKLQINQSTFKRLDTAWASIYAREFGREKMREHELKKEEMREVKREYAQALARGEEFKGRWPERVDHPYRSRDHQEREARIYGIDEARVGRGERSVAIPDHGVREGERIIAETVRTVEGVREELRGILERGISREGWELER